MLSRKKLVLIGLVIIIIVFVAAVRISPFLADVIVRGFSRVHYNDDSDTTDAIVNSLLLFFAFSIVTVYWNVRMLRSINKVTIAQLSLQSLVDLGLISVSILIMVIKNNSKKIMPDMTSLINPVALLLVPLCKHLVLSLTRRKKQSA